MCFETDHFSKYVFVEEDITPSMETKPEEHKEEQPREKAKAAITPKTGDNTPIMVYVFGTIAGVIVLGASFSRKRKAN